MEKRELIRQLMPLIDEIKEEKLRNGVVEVWVKAWEESEWEDIADCPFLVEVQECSLIQHTNYVASVAMAMASFARDTWRIQVNTDLLLAGALLHDVSKVLEWAPQEGKPARRSAIAENLVHGSYGVHLALNAGMPLPVAHLIGTHTPQVSRVPKVIEGIFLCYADYAAADVFNLDKGLPLLLEAFTPSSTIKHRKNS